jgi:hypothetical protein
VNILVSQVIKRLEVVAWLVLAEIQKLIAMERNIAIPVEWLTLAKALKPAHQQNDVLE